MRISDWSSDVCSSDLLPDLATKHFTPIGMALLGGVLALQIGLWGGLDRWVQTGLAVLLGGWAIALVVLAGVLRQGAIAARPRCWNAWSAWAALLLGIVGLSTAQIGREQVWTPVTHAHHVCRILLETKQI